MLGLSCYHPLKRWTVGVNPQTGKSRGIVTGYLADHIDVLSGDRFEVSHVSEVSSRAIGTIREFVEIPCGKCIGCRLEYSRQWANRCMLELPYHEHSWFVTLTYNDIYVPRTYYSDPDTGEAYEAYTLRLKDLQDFFKRLRFNSGQELRYFAAGEYGDKFMRPHYHAIIFGLKLDDLVPFGRNELGHQYYRSPILEHNWSNRLPGKVYELLGYVGVAPVTWETCAYTARYVMKKLKGQEAHFYDDHNLEPPFTVMSRRPGIAAQWYIDHPGCMEQDYINIATPTGGRKFRPPRYYDLKYDIEYPEESAARKAKRKDLSLEMQKLRLMRSDLSYLELLQVDELYKQAQLQSLKRRLDYGS